MFVFGEWYEIGSGYQNDRYRRKWELITKMTDIFQHNRLQKWSSYEKLKLKIWNATKMAVIHQIQKNNGHVGLD